MKRMGTDSPAEEIGEVFMSGVLVHKETKEEHLAILKAKVMRSTVNDSISSTQVGYTKKYAEGFEKAFGSSN